MTDIKKIDVTKQMSATKPGFQLQQLADAVNMLQGITDPQQRAVREFEMQSLSDRVTVLETRLKRAGIP
jgi:hypothetical protein